METSPSSHRRFQFLLLGCLVALFAFSLHLALTRIYQVDEAQNVFTARILASHWEARHHLWIEIWHLWPLAWFAGWIQDSVGLYHACRLFMLAIFWINLILTALNCGFPWRSRAFLLTLIGAATLTPLWDYGFEIRHDNLLLTFLLLYLLCFRIGGKHQRLAAFMLGVLMALLELTVFKAVVYWLPMAALFIAFPPRAWSLSRWRILSLLFLGLLSTSALVLILVAISGRMPFLVDGILTLFSLSAKPTSRYPPWPTFTRLFHQTPMLLGVAVAAATWTLVHLKRRWRQSCVWESVLPELALTSLVAFSLLVHPLPLPYHLCLLVPFAFILAVRWLSTFNGFPELRSPWTYLWISILAFTHLTPFLSNTLRHLEFTNQRQEQLIQLAETMTDPAMDRVYDAAGLVASRESIHPQWFLHTMFMDRFKDGSLPPIREMLEERPASVLIPNYRFHWIEEQDREFIRANYLYLANDFLILGQSLQGPHSEFVCLQPGRYHVLVKSMPKEAARPVVTLDGNPIKAPSVQVLTRGRHAFQLEGGAEIQVAWLGPNLDRPPRLSPGDSDRVFINWY